MRKPKIIVFDLETLPNLQEALKVWPQLSQYPGKTLRATICSIICAGWKTLGSKKTHCINAWDYSRWKKDVNDDYSVVKAIHKVLKDADAVITHNGKKFDWKFLQTRIMFHKLTPLHKIKHIDTCQLSRQHLYAFNNRLGTVGTLLADEKKLAHTGWQLWVDVWHKDKKAMKLMEDYCKQDVDLLEKCFKRLMPLVNNMPNYNLYRSEKQRNEDAKLCHNCGSEDLVKNGFYGTKTMMYQRVRCKQCGTSHRLDANGNKPRTF
jgi:DNA polymerase elongation subunit (family B)